jgi:hypothetical protein
MGSYVIFSSVGLIGLANRLHATRTFIGFGLFVCVFCDSRSDSREPSVFTHHLHATCIRDHARHAYFSICKLQAFTSIRKRTKTNINYNLTGRVGEQQILLQHNHGDNQQFKTVGCTTRGNRRRVVIGNERCLQCLQESPSYSPLWSLFLLLRYLPRCHYLCRL